MTIRQDMHFFLLNLTQKTFLKCRHTKGYGSAGVFKQSQATIAPTDTESLRETVIKKTQHFIFQPYPATNGILILFNTRREAASTRTMGAQRERTYVNEATSEFFQ